MYYLFIFKGQQMEGTLEREGITVQKMSRWGIELQSASHFFGEQCSLRKGREINLWYKESSCSKTNPPIQPKHMVAA